MQFIYAILVIFWWISMWGIFDIYTEDKTRDEKLQIYVILLGIVLLVAAFYPGFLCKL